MDELKSETETKIQDSGNLQIPIPTPVLQVNGPKSNGILIAAFVIIILIIAGLSFWYYSKKPNVNPSPTTKTVVTKATSTLQTINYVPDGPLKDLVLEPQIKPAVNETTVSSDGMTTTKWVYTSEVDLDRFYYLDVTYLRTKKGWLVTEISPANPDEQKSFTATKNNYTATVEINKGDGLHARINITVIYPIIGN